MASNNRDQRLQNLLQATQQYVQNEQTVINNQVSVLQAVLNGRTGGAGVQASSTAVVAAVAQNDIATYLQG
jgi:hypothetical protein